MRSSLATMCSRFIENRDIVKSTFVWDSTYMYPICAAIITEKGMRAGKVIADKIASILDEISTGISDEDRVIFYRSLNVISENIDKVAKSYKNER